MIFQPRALMRAITYHKVVPFTVSVRKSKTQMSYVYGNLFTRCCHYAPNAVILLVGFRITFQYQIILNGEPLTDSVERVQDN